MYICTDFHVFNAAIIQKGVRLSCMKTVDTATGWFEIFEVPFFNLDKESRGNIEYIEKYYARVRQLFNQNFLCRYPCLQNFVVSKSFKFK